MNSAMYSSTAFVAPWGIKSERAKVPREQMKYFPVNARETVDSESESSCAISFWSIGFRAFSPEVKNLAVPQLGP